MDVPVRVFRLVNCPTTARLLWSIRSSLFSAFTFRLAFAPVRPSSAVGPRTQSSSPLPRSIAPRRSSNPRQGR